MTNKILTEEETDYEKVKKDLPINTHSDNYKIKINNSKHSLIKNMMIDNHKSYKENRNLLGKATKDLNNSNRLQSELLMAEICRDSNKLIIIDIIIILIIIIYSSKYIIIPLIHSKKPTDLLKLSTTIKFYSKKYTTGNNIYVLFLYFIITILFISFSNYQLQNIGIVMFISFITSIASASNLLVSGALFSGITIYLFLRLRAVLFTQNDKINKCNIPLLTALKNIILRFIHSIKS